MKKLIFLLLVLPLILVGCMGFGMVGMHGMNHNHDHGAMNSEKHSADSSIIRTGEIDLIAIDQNNDDKVFQDQMHWNVISDKAENCPICNMKLKEVSLDKAKENLIKNGFKVK
ncbi:MAG: heavy metal-binding domain-containing protein [Stygiobacter sp.]